MLRAMTVCASALSLVLMATACEAPAGEGEGEGEGELDIPPTGAEAVGDWLATGRYLEWDCEADVHAPRAPSPHPRNRICSNPLLASSLPGEGIPVGAASVKEIYNEGDDDTIVAWAIGVKVADGDETDPASMYWFEGDGVNEAAADGLGDSGGIAQNVCYDCHSHGPEAGGQEQFFTIVR